MLQQQNKKYKSSSKGIIQPSFEFKWKNILTTQLEQLNPSSSSSSESKEEEEEEEMIINGIPPYPPFNSQLEVLNQQSFQSNQVIMYLTNLQNTKQLQLPSTNTNNLQQQKEEIIKNDLLRLSHEMITALEQSQKVLKGIFCFFFISD